MSEGDTLVYGPLTVYQHAYDPMAPNVDLPVTGGEVNGGVVA